MKIKFLLFMLVLCLALPFINAEFSLNQQVIVDNSTSSVDMRGYYILDLNVNSTLNPLLTRPENFMIFVNIPELNYSVGLGVVDRCDLFIYKNDILDINNTYNSSNTGGGFFDYKGYVFTNSTIIKVDMICHYTNLSDYYQFGELAGTIGAGFDSDSCKACNNLDFGTVVKRSINDNPENNINFIQKIIDYNWFFWLIGSWIIKILFVFSVVAIFLFAVYFIYLFIKNIEVATR